MARVTIPARHAAPQGRKTHMISLENLLLFVPMAALLVMLPGPDFALIAKISLLNGRPQGQAAACGVALGIGVHTTAAMLGISAIIAQSVLWFNALKYAGAAYLIWLGIQALRHGRQTSAAVVKVAPKTDDLPPSQHANSLHADSLHKDGPRADNAHGAAPAHKATVKPAAPARLTGRQWWSFFRQGFLTNTLNPKAVIIFLTFLPQFMNPHAPLAPQFLELGAILSVLCLIWYIPLAYMLGRVRHIFENSRFQLWLQRFTGFIFIAFGLKLAAAQSR